MSEECTLAMLLEVYTGLRKQTKRWSHFHHVNGAVDIGFKGLVLYVVKETMSAIPCSFTHLRAIAMVKRTA